MVVATDSDFIDTVPIPVTGDCCIPDQPKCEIGIQTRIPAIIPIGVEIESVVAVDAYLRSLKPVPSPYLVDGGLSRRAERGAQLFESGEVGCSRCHPAPLYTDRRMHDVGTRTRYEQSDRFDTPTLVEVWRTAPYLHDGRYTTIRDLVVEGRHGLPDARFEKLTAQQLDDLIEYVLSL